MNAKGGNCVESVVNKMIVFISVLNVMFKFEFETVKILDCYHPL